MSRPHTVAVMSRPHATAVMTTPHAVAVMSRPSAGQQESAVPTVDEMQEWARSGRYSPGHFCTIPAPTADDLREFAKRLRALAKDIFQGGQGNHYLIAEAGRLRHPLVTRWYFRVCCFPDKEQQRFFYKGWMLLGDIASGTAESPRERLESLATDVDELAARIDTQPATVEPPAEPQHNEPSENGSSMLSCPDLAKQFGVKRGALEKRLERFRGSNDGGWSEIQNRQRNQPRYLYRVDVVMPIISDLRRTNVGRTSDGKK